MKLSKKYHLLMISCLYIFHSIAAAEKLPEDNFEAFRNRGLHEFFDKFSQSNFVGLGFEDPNERQKRIEEEYRQKSEQEAAEANVREEEKWRQKIERQAKRLEEGIAAAEVQEKLKIAEDDLISLKNQLEESRKKVEAEEIKRQTFETQARQYIENLKRQLEESQKKLVAEEIKKQTSEIEKTQAALQAKQNIENLKKQLEATQKEVNELKSQFQLAQQWEVEAEQQRKIQAEQQMVKQKTEQREKQEKIALWCSGMDITIQYINYLKYYDFTYGELLKALKAMKIYHMEEIHRLESRSNGGTFGNGDDIIGKIRSMWNSGGCADIVMQDASLYIVKYEWQETRYRCTTPHSNSKFEPIITILSDLLIKKMEKYEELQGHIHPLRDEVSRL